MEINTAQTLKDVDHLIDHLTQMKQTLESREPADIINLFSLRPKGLHSVTGYSKNTSQLLDSLSDYFNEKLTDHPFRVRRETSYSNGSSLIIYQNQNDTIAELSLHSKSVFVRKRIFHPIVSNQKELSRILNNFESERKRIESYQKELVDFKKMNSFSRKLKGITPEKLVKIEEFVKQHEDDFNSMKERKIQLEKSLTKDWMKSFELHHAIKKLLVVLKQMDFTHDYHAMASEKHYQAFYRYQTNHSHSGVLTYEEGHVSILNAPEQDYAYGVDANFTPLCYTDEEFEHLASAFASIDGLSDLSKSSDSVTLHLTDGTIKIDKTGSITTHGSDVNLFHVLRHEKARESLHLLYKDKP